MTPDPSIREQLEAFRPGVDDLADDTWRRLREECAANPETAQSFSQVKAHDAAVRAAMHDVPLPPGLPARLLAALPASVETTAIASPTAAIQVAERPLLRRRVLSLTLSLAGLAATLLIAVGLWRLTGPAPRMIGQDELLEIVARWDQPAGEKWSPIADGVALASHPVTEADLVASIRGYQLLKTAEEPSVAVYELVDRHGRTAKLYVAATVNEYYVATRPLTPLPGLTASKVAGAWQRGGNLYVVVVDARQSRFEDFIRLSPADFA